jgi:hypothetical protein
VAAAVLHAQQLVGALVELVVPTLETPRPIALRVSTEGVVEQAGDEVDLDGLVAATVRLRPSPPLRSCVSLVDRYSAPPTGVPFGS